ncbi:MAG: DUF1295 domain-containing protein [Alphaproteobacteria bacterium]|nr:DUF1295 domain-containing protein [Alphaproteobacteria bacterium]
MAKPDTADVIAPPPLIVLAGLLAGYGLDFLWPAPSLPNEFGYPLGVLLGVTGLAAALPALRGFRRAGTSPEPWHPSTALVTEGLYKYTRNPMYVGLTLIYLAIAAAFGGAWLLAMLLPTLATLHYGVILREERYLDAKFGEAYRAYKASVRRWL